MCLHIKDNNIELSGTETVCWKIVSLVRDKDGEVSHFTPFCYEPIDKRLFALDNHECFGTSKEEDRRLLSEIHLETCKLIGMVDVGYIHTYATLEEANDVLSNRFMPWADDPNECKRWINGELRTIVGYEIWECVIPPCTPFWRGESVINDYQQGVRVGCTTYSSYASARIEFRRKVRTEMGKR